jgi:hypothetical protein
MSLVAGVNRTPAVQSAARRCTDLTPQFCEGIENITERASSQCRYYRHGKECREENHQWLLQATVKGVVMEGRDVHAIPKSRKEVSCLVGMTGLEAFPFLLSIVCHSSSLGPERL